jgi:Tfp pilus assembly protein PilO
MKKGKTPGMKTANSRVSRSMSNDDVVGNAKKGGKGPKKHKRNLSSLKSFAVPGLAIILLVVVTLDFTSSRLKPVRDEVTRTNQQVEMIRKQAIQGQAVLANPAVTDAENAAAREKMPSDPELSEVIAQIDKLARDSKLTWTAGAPSASPITDPNLPATIRAWSMGTSFTGSITGMYRFLDKLNTLDRVVTVETLSLQQSSGVYTASAVLRFYALGE